MKLSLIISLFLGVLLTLPGCKEPLDTDVEEPRITGFTVNGGTTNLVLNAGDSLHFELAFEDDVDLQKYRIQIKKDFTPLIGFSPFEYDSVIAIDGLVNTASTSIGIPTDATSGIFDVIVEVMDESSNVSLPKTVQLTILTAGMPLLTLNSPDPLTTIVATPGDTIPMNGSVSDDAALDNVYLTLTRETEIGTQALYFQTFTYPNITFTTWNLDTLETDSVPFNIPLSAQTGVYVLEFAATDTAGNFSAVRANLEVQ